MIYVCVRMCKKAAIGSDELDGSKRMPATHGTGCSVDIILLASVHTRNCAGKHGPKAATTGHRRSQVDRKIYVQLY